jgi:hypothetical protein
MEMRMGPFGGFWRVVLVGFLLAGALVLRNAAGGPTLGGIKAGFMLVFLTMGPGLAVVGLLRLDDLMLELSLSLAVSLSLETVLAVGMILLKHWAPQTEFAVLAGLAGIGAIAQTNQVAQLKHRNRSKDISRT